MASTRQYNPRAISLPRVGVMRLLSIVSLVLAGGLIAALGSMDSRTRGGARPVTLLCAVALSPAIERIVQDYEALTGETIRVRFGGSGVLLGDIRLGVNADLYLPADASYLEQAGDLVHRSTALVRLTPVIAVRAGNPLHISTLEDLLRPDVRVGLADPNTAAVGRAARAALRTANLWESISTRAVVFKPTVSDLATDVTIGTIDAAILWGQLARASDGIEQVRTPELDAISRIAAIGRLDGPANDARVDRFVRYLRDPAAGLVRFAQLGYDTRVGDEQ